MSEGTRVTGEGRVHKKNSLEASSHEDLSVSETPHDNTRPTIEVYCFLAKMVF